MADEAYSKGNNPTDNTVQRTRAWSGFWVVFAGDLAIAAGAAFAVWKTSHAGADTTSMVAILTSAFTAISTMTTAYFGIKTMSNTAQSFAKAHSDVMKSARGNSGDSAGPGSPGGTPPGHAPPGQGPPGQGPPGQGPPGQVPPGQVPPGPGPAAAAARPAAPTGPRPSAPTGPGPGRPAAPAGFASTGAAAPRPQAPTGPPRPADSAQPTAAEIVARMAEPPRPADQ